MGILGWQTVIFWNCSVCKTKFSAPFVIYQGAHRPAVCACRLKFSTLTISLQNRQEATLILNHENVNIRSIGQGEAQNRKYKRLEKFGGWLAGIRSMNCLDCDYVLGQYMNSKINLLYITLTADLRRCRSLKKRYYAKITYKIKSTYVYIDNTHTRTVTCYKTDPSSRQGVRPMTDKIPQLSWLQPKSGHESLRGSMPRRTDWWLTN
jgi:hypothetical protein